MKILIAYATSYRSTAAIARRIAERLRGHGADAVAADIHSLWTRIDASAFDAIIVGGRVRANRYPRRVTRFVRENLDALRAGPSAFFSVCLWSVSKLEAHRAKAREVPRRYLARLGWAPDRVEIIAGTLALSRHGFFGRRLMQAIWKKDLGPLDPARDHVFTDWEQVDAFADSFLRAAEARVGASAAMGSRAKAPSLSGAA